MQPRISFWKPIVLLLSVTLLMSAFAQAQAEPGLDPPLVEAEIADGDSLVIVKRVSTPEFPPLLDVCFLADTTGSMTAALANVQTNIGSIMTTVSGSGADSRFCAAQYRDRGDSPVYQLDQDLTAIQADVQTAVNNWTAGGGGDTPEGALHALTLLSTDASWRGPPTTHIIVWFGDASSHDPSVGGETLASTIAALNAAGISVLAINVDSGGADGLDAAGQATAIANGTGGAYLGTASPNEVSGAILDGLSNLPIEVAMASDCSDPISVSFSPGTQTVTSGEPAFFFETISVNATPAQQGQTYECDDWATINGEPMTEADGDVIYEHKVITVPDTTPPTAACTPTTNPSGRNVPAAPGNGGQGQNQDGFYQLLGRDIVDPNPQIFVTDDASGAVFGPFAIGTKIKLTQAPGATPSIKAGPGAIDWHITLKGDAIVTAVDAAGNVSAPVSCRVPPPPQ